jgi:hypothetical protein
LIVDILSVSDGYKGLNTYVKGRMGERRGRGLVGPQPDVLRAQKTGGYEILVAPLHGECPYRVAEN